MMVNPTQNLFVPPLPVVETIAKAVAFVWQQRNDFLTLAFPAILVLSILNTGVVLVLLPDNPQASSTDAEQLQAAVQAGIMPLLILIIPFGFFWTTFAIAWHRKFLLPKECATVKEILTWRTRHTRFLLYAIGLTFVTSVVLIVGLSLAAFAPVLLVLVLAGAVVVCAPVPGSSQCCDRKWAELWRQLGAHSWPHRPPLRYHRRNLVPCGHLG
jgi:hypothetical protein